MQKKHSCDETAVADARFLFFHSVLSIREGERVWIVKRVREERLI